MPKPKVKHIFVKNGQPDTFKQKTKRAEAVVWVPEAAFDTLDIQFQSGSPFNAQRLTAADKGDCVGALVTGADNAYPYTLTVISLDGSRIEAEPEIIVDTGSNVPSPKKRGKGKNVAKKNARGKGGRKKGGKKKAAKKR